MTFRNKKSQITVFIILAIVLLFSTALLFYIRERITAEDRPVVFPTMEEVPIEMQPLQMFVVECIEKTSTEALTQIGLHGGYLSLDPKDFNMTKKFFNLDPAGINPTEFDAVTFSSDSGWTIPYWYHLSSDNDCTGTCSFEFNRPPLYRNEGESSIENQLDRYILENVEACFNDFAAFRNFQVNKQGELEVTSIIAKENVNIHVKYPLEVSGQRGLKEIENFNVIIPVNMRHIYELATDILNTQQTGRFLEGHTLNVISAFAGLDSDKLPPLAATDFGYKPYFWSKTEVKKKLQDYLMLYTMRLQTKNTFGYAPYDFPGNRIKQGLYQSMELPLNNSYPDLSVDFTYLAWWPIYLDLGGSGEIVTSTESAVGIFKFLPIKQYRTPYDISYPVIVEIDMPHALRNQGYKFYFALESNIRNNHIINETFTPLRKARFAGQGQFCNQNQRNSGEITVEVVDYNGEPVPDAAVFFSASTSCLLGATSIDENGKSTFTGKFPIGIGAVSVVHPDYAEYVQQYATVLDKEDKITIVLDKYKEIPVSASKLNLFKDLSSEENKWKLDTSPKPLTKNEQVIIVMQKKKEMLGEEDFVAVAQISGDEKSTMRVIPGEYDITIQLILYNTTVIIPEHELCNEDGIIKQCVDVPEIKLGENMFYAGTLEIGNWTLKREKFYGDFGIKFNAINFDLASVPLNERDMNDLEEMDKFEGYAQRFRLQFNPKYVK